MRSEKVTPLLVMIVGLMLGLMVLSAYVLQSAVDDCWDDE